MCRSCGAIVGGGQGQCAVCGASTTSTTSPARRRTAVDRETMRFARAILNRPYKFTIILLTANFFLFLLMWQSSGMATQTLWLFPRPVLLAYGAKLNSLISAQHQWWRFVTPMFVHVGLLHLLVNMYSLWIIGPYVEKLYGSAKFVVFWIMTGTAGVVASYLTVVNSDRSLGPLARFLFKTQDSASAGASGALFGLVGVLFVFGIKFRHELPEGFKRAFGTGMLPVILINLFIGYMAHDFIDNAAHLGGLISGAALAIVVGYRRPGERASVTVLWHVMQIVSIGVVAISFFKVVQHFPRSLATETVQLANDRSADFLTYAKATSDALEAIGAIHDNDTSNVDRALKSLDSVPHLDQEADQLKERLKLLLLKAKQTNGVAVPAPQPASNKPPQEQSDLTKEFVSWKKDYDQWLKTVGRNYGGLIEAPAIPAQK
jgi:rhomboid protease GluP